MENHWSPDPDTVRVTHAELGVHNTPFTPKPEGSTSIRHALEQAGRGAQPHALNTWEDRKKTFAVSWSDGHADLRVTIFKKAIPGAPDPWVASTAREDTA
jgi:hypothetical protein